MDRPSVSKLYVTMIVVGMLAIVAGLLFGLRSFASAHANQDEKPMVVQTSRIPAYMQQRVEALRTTELNHFRLPLQPDR